MRSQFRTKLKKLLLVRLLLTIFLLLLIIAAQQQERRSSLGRPLSALLIFSIILPFHYPGSMGHRADPASDQVCLAQILFDIAAVTALVFLSGGIESSFSFLYFLVIISSALLLYRRGSILTASSVRLCLRPPPGPPVLRMDIPAQLVSKAPDTPGTAATYLLHILMNIAGFYLVGLWRAISARNCTSPAGGSVNTKWTCASSRPCTRISSTA